ncbi:hypothetical protein [Apilactobacillus ozensis]|uniref:hypothetical protein n=1 Tax=Apilactobacillus ozensis TaxID=866801 RepID=UPI00200A18CC|nr:hypothetical protein [Apilactobacillus ozensis]MCK8606822.1 hypothetical protein [Apilactobacillus ozensis]
MQLIDGILKKLLSANHREAPFSSLFSLSDDEKEYIKSLDTDVQKAILEALLSPNGNDQLNNVDADLIQKIVSIKKSDKVIKLNGTYYNYKIVLNSANNQYRVTGVSNNTVILVPIEAFQK